VLVETLFFPALLLFRRNWWQGSLNKN